MSFQTYENICELLYVGGDDEYLFTNAFLAVEWNLIAQSDNCVNTCLNRVLRQDDCLLLFFGENLKEIRLDILQRNPGTFIRDPNSPHLCPVLSLKKNLLSHPDLLKNGFPLFLGDSQYERLIKIFHKVIRENKDIFEKLGVESGRSWVAFYQKRFYNTVSCQMHCVSSNFIHMPQGLLDNHEIERRC